METEKRTEEQKRTEALALLKSILEIPSVNGKDREQETAVYLAEYLKRKGMETRVQLIDEHHGNVIGVLRGKTEETILFNGHLDGPIWRYKRMEYQSGCVRRTGWTPLCKRRQ